MPHWRRISAVIALIVCRHVHIVGEIAYMRFCFILKHDDNNCSVHFYACGYVQWVLSHSSSKASKEVVGFKFIGDSD